MGIDGLTDEDIRDILVTAKRIAVVGASNRPERASYYVAEFLAENGKTVVPINPGIAGQVMHGNATVATLAEAVPLDLVYIFRAADQVGPIVDEAIRLGAKTIWLPLGIVAPEAAQRARAAGLRMAMNRCAMIEWPRLRLPA
jgi:uncharacterized protein